MPPTIEAVKDQLRRRISSEMNAQTVTDVMQSLEGITIEAQQQGPKKKPKKREIIKKPKKQPSKPRKKS